MYAVDDDYRHATGLAGRVEIESILFGVAQLLFWIVVGLLCIGVGSVRLHYNQYLLKAASHDDEAAHQAMAAELTLIHGVPFACSEGEYLRELQNALIWINFRFYLAPLFLFWFVVGGPYGPVLPVGYAFAGAAELAGKTTIRRSSALSPALTACCMCWTGFRCGWPM